MPSTAIGATAISRMNPEDRAAYADARIAAVHAGLKLTADQEKLWPPVEAAVREFAKLRIDRANARMNAPQDDSSQQKPDDPVARLRDRADNMAATAAAMKKIAEAADPLYKTLDDGQKRRLAVLTRFGGREGWRHHRFEREMGMDRDWRPATAATTAIAMTATAARTGAARTALTRRRIGARSEHRQKPLKSSGFLPFRRSGQSPGKLAPACWTSPSRFAKRRPLARAFRTKIRAHSSVGRADDS